MIFIDTILGRRPASTNGQLPNAVHADNQFEPPNPPQVTPDLVYRFFSDAKPTKPHTVRATLTRDFHSSWPYKPDFLEELKKSHPECHFDNAVTPSAVIFTHNAAVTFEQAYKAHRSRSPQASVTM